MDRCAERRATSRQFNTKYHKNHFKLVLAVSFHQWVSIINKGDDRAGKTTYLFEVMRRFGIPAMGRTLNDPYVPTVACEVTTITLDTTHGPVTFDVWDTAGNEEYRGLGDVYFKDVSISSSKGVKYC